MERLREVPVGALPPARLTPVIGAERAARFEEMAGQARRILGGRVVMNVNSTAVGGGVAEMLQTLLGYLRGAGLDARWTVLGGNPDFFTITKRIHNRIHGSPGDGGALGAGENEIFRTTTTENAAELLAMVERGDFVLLHDPQTAGLVEPLKQAGAIVAWRSHIGCDEPNEWSEAAWEFLRPYLADVDAYVFSREGYAPSWLDRARLWIIPPSIDPFAPKNVPLPQRTISRILAYTGVLRGDVVSTPIHFERRDGTVGRLDRHADILQTGPPPPNDAPLVVQVSRWDRLKDMQGVMESFAAHVAGATSAHLLLVGPNVSGVTDDPEGGLVLRECMERWQQLPHSRRSRIHLACIPTADVDENAVIVNAIQRHATIVTQKSLAEGFGLTVAEAMWKRRPVVASRVGGISDQITHGENGILVDDPSDLATFGDALRGILADPAAARRLGRNAALQARDFFLGDRHLSQYAEMIASLLGGEIEPNPPPHRRPGGTKRRPPGPSPDVTQP